MSADDTQAQHVEAPRPEPVADDCGCSRRLTDHDINGHDFVSHSGCGRASGVATICARCGAWAGKALGPCLKPVADPLPSEAVALTVEERDALFDAVGEIRERYRVSDDVEQVVRRILTARLVPEDPLPSEATAPPPLAVALDKDGDAWQRHGARWIYIGDASRACGWNELQDRYGPLRRLVPEDDEDTPAEPGRLRIEDGWLVREANHHTCGTGPDGYYGAHEPGCGLVPEVHLSTLPGWPSTEDDEDTVRVPREAIERLRASRLSNRHLVRAAHDLLDVLDEGAGS